MKTCYCIGPDKCSDKECRLVQDWLKANPHLELKEPKPLQGIEEDRFYDTTKQERGEK